MRSRSIPGLSRQPHGSWENYRIFLFVENKGRIHTRQKRRSKVHLVAWSNVPWSRNAAKLTPRATHRALALIGDGTANNKETNGLSTLDSFCRIPFFNCRNAIWTLRNMIHETRTLITMESAPPTFPYCLWEWGMGVIFMSSVSDKRTFTTIIVLYL